MKLLLDQGLPRSAAILLRESNIDAVHVGEIAMSEAEDIAIITRAAQDNRIVVTGCRFSHLTSSKRINLSIIYSDSD